jgi:hypothetical protein
MKYLFIITLCFNVLAKTPINFDVCEREANDFGSTAKINSQCKKLSLSSINPEQMFKGEKVSAIGYKNIVFIDYNLRNTIKNFVIAGDRTLLTDVKAIAVSENEEKIWVLNNKQVFTYNTLSNGNVSPSQVLDVDGVNCNQILGNDSQKTFYVKCENKIIQGHLLGDVRLKNVNKKPYVNVKLNHHSDTDLKLYQGTLLMMDKRSNELVSFDADISKKSSWKMDLNKEGGLRKPSSLNINNGEIIIKDDLGKEHSFK